MEKSSFLRCRINALFNVLLVLALLMIPCLSTAALTGPVDAPPGGAAVTITPNTDGDIGKAGGRTYTYSDIVRANEGGLVYWGITEDSVKLSLDFDTDYVGDEVMTFDPARSDLPNGIVVWVGSTSIYNAITRTTVTLTGTYFTLTVTDDLGAPLALTQPDTVGLPAGMGGVLEVTAGMEFNANMIFRIADGTPAYDYYNAYPTIGSVAYTSVDYGFYYNPVEISDIGDQLIQINSTSDPYTFTISNATGTPLLSGTSSDQSVVADAGITFSYVDPDWTVTIVPVADASGSTTITISVTDEDELTATETFVLTVNGPPTLTANQPIAVNRGGSVVLTTTQLSASDNESGPEELDFLVGPDGNGGPPRFGELLLDGTPLAAGESFTQQQLADGLVSYQHDDSCDQPADDFQFDVRDADGGSAVLAATAGQYQSYTFAGFLVQYPNRAPVAIDDAISIPMGVPYSGTLTSSDDDCVQQQMTYSIVTNGSRGTAVITDAATGAYTYTPAPGELGSDSFTFMVNDGTADAATPGTITIEIENQAPTANDLAASTTENDPVSGMLSGSDADLPAQTLTYGLNTDGTLGSVFISASSGMFTYTPLPGAFGEDTFTYYVRDGYVNSAPATVTVSIAPDLNNGDLLISGSVDTQVVEEPPGDVMAVMDAEIDNGCRVVLVDPVNGYEAVVASGGLIGEAREIRGIAVESCRTILLIDGTEGASRLLRVNLLTGEQSVVYSDLVFPIDVVVEASGNILISDGPVGIKRIDPSGGLIGVFSGSEVTFATGLTVATEGAIFASNAGVASGMPGAYSSVLKIDPVPTLITANENLFLPIGITLGTDENLYVAEALPIFTDGVGTSAIVRVLADGSQEMVAADGDLMGPTDVIEHTTGELLVTNMMGGDLVSVDPDTGNTFMFKITDLLDRAWALTVLPNDDSDGDGIPDECDICDGDDTVDSDGDGVPDACDICPLGDDAVDVDLDGVPDACDICFPGDDTLDADEDGVPDACDICPGGDDAADADGDGTPDYCDACPNDPDNDIDGDGICGDVDSCPNGNNNLDADGDGIPDGCDPDAYTCLPPTAIYVPASSDTGEYLVTWDPSPTPDVIYTLVEATDPAFTQNVRNAYIGTELSFLITDREAGHYYYQARANRADLTRSIFLVADNGCAVSADAALLEPPASLTVPASATTIYTVSWEASPSAGVTYVLEEATDANFTTGQNVAYSGTALSASIDKRYVRGASGTTFYYRVKAIRSGDADSDYTETGNGCTFTLLSTRSSRSR